MPAKKRKANGTTGTSVEDEFADALEALVECTTLTIEQKVAHIKECLQEKCPTWYQRVAESTSTDLLLAQATADRDSTDEKTTAQTIKIYKKALMSRRPIRKSRGIFERCVAVLGKCAAARLIHTSNREWIHREGDAKTSPSFILTNAKEATVFALWDSIKEQPELAESCTSLFELSHSLGTMVRIRECCVLVHVQLTCYPYDRFA